MLHEIMVVLTSDGLIDRFRNDALMMGIASGEAPATAKAHG
jgi:hypothetical protein